MTEASLLIVDDDKYVLAALRRIFAQEEVTVLLETKPEEALTTLRKLPISVVISDNMMPGMNGIEFLEKARLISPDTMRIMMTGNSDQQIIIEAINRCEVFRFITKPWDPFVVKKIVHEAMGQYEIVRSLRDADEGKLRSLAQAIELKDHYTKGHCDRVADYALLLATHVGIDEDTKRLIKQGCWLHDCGKIGVPEAILNFNGPLSPENLEVVRKHPQWGADVARKAKLPDIIVNIVLYHHERFGGGGYPTGISGEAIPLEARIAAIADIYDALSSDRPYRKGFSREKTLEIMKKMTSDGFMEPRLVDLFLSAVATHELEVGQTAA